MEFEYSYLGRSAVSSSASETTMRFAPDTGRPPTFFGGSLRRQVPYREAMSALHDVVVSDLRTKGKDKSAYKAWAAEREQRDWQEVAAQRADVKQRVEALQGEIEDLRHRRETRWGEFYKSRQRYFEYLYKRDKDVWFVLDPVVSVHPDEVSFECFSLDESTYGRVGVKLEAFAKVDEHAYGTTNVDYSAALYDEFQKMRSYKETRLSVDPAGFAVQSDGDAEHREVKIDLPDSWVRGFLQVGAAMTLDAVTCDLHPMDVHNLCFVLRRHRELKGPRAMRFVLKPGEPVRIVFEPWEIEVRCPRSPYLGHEAREVRIWGRRRIHVLERLIPTAKSFRVHLLGYGMPTFWVADLGDMSFTLGLSGWTANDWSQAGSFDLLAPRMAVDELTRTRVLDGLKRRWLATADELAQDLDMERAPVLGALSLFTQAGRVMHDLTSGRYRVRELSRAPLPLDGLRFLDPREEAAERLVAAQGVRVTDENSDDSGMTRMQGKVQAGEKTFLPTLVIDADERLVQGECTCNFFQQNRLRRGPCEHMLALRRERGQERMASIFDIFSRRARA